MPKQNILQYTSPFLLLNLPTAIPDQNQFLLAKERILAESDRTPSNTMLISGREYSRNNILQLFKETEQGDNLAYHSAVAADKNLLEFLEGKANLQLSIYFIAHPGYQSPKFLAWMAPYFLHAFTGYFDKLTTVPVNDSDIATFENGNDIAWKNLLGTRMLVDEEHEALLWSKVASFFEPKLTDIQDLVSAEQEQRRLGLTEKTMELCEKRLTSVLQHLPEHRFESLRNKYALAMMELLTIVYETSPVKYKRYAIETLMDAKALAVDEYYKTQIQAKRDELLSLFQVSKSSGRSTASSSSGSNTTTWIVIGVVLFAVIGLAIIFNDSESHLPVATAEPVDVSEATIAPMPDTNIADRPIIYDVDPPVQALDTFIAELRKANDLDGIGTVSTTLKTGEDVYRNLWSQPFFAGTERKQTELRFKITNNSPMDLILFVANKNRVFSVYVAYMDSTTIKLAKGSNTLYMYLGRAFKTGKGFPIKPKDSKMAAGIFTEYTHPNSSYLSSPLTQIVGEKDKEAGILQIWEHNGRVDYDLESMEKNRIF